MNTLPTLLTHTATKAGKAAPAAATDSLLAGDSLPQGFITELGNRLLTLARQQGTDVQSTDPAAEMQEKGLTKASLAALLQALDKPEALNALLQPEKAKAGLKSADDTDKSEATSLTASDLQNVQALFAMLPVAVENRSAQPAVAENNTATLTGTRASLTAALSGTLQSAVQEDATPGDGTAKKGSSALASLAGNASTSATAGTAHTASASTSASSSNGLTLDAQFQQVLNTLSKPEERHSDSGSSNSSLNAVHNMLSSTAPLVSPAASSSNAAPSTPMLNAQLGSHEWQQALGQQIVMFSRNGQQNAELRLHPEDLGAIQISLTLDKDQAQLNMVSGHSHVRAALEAALPQLRSALAESGINLGQSNVSSDAFAQGQSYQGQQEGRRDGQYGSFTLSQDSDNEITPIAVPAALQARAAGNGAVDIFA